MKELKFVCNFWTVIVLTNNKYIYIWIWTDENAGTNNKKDLIKLNRLSSGYKSTGKFLKAILLLMYGSAYPSHFGNARSEIMKQFVTSKVIGEINDNASCLPCLK